MELERIVTELEEIEHARSFVAVGHCLKAPTLRVAGLGTVPLPVVPLLLPALRSVSQPAPHGRGPETVVDPTVRRCHQMDADQVDVPLAFVDTVDEIAREAAKRLGVDGKVRPNLYKLLVYGPGDFFLPHRDTEKEPGMFGTLVITLPGEFVGGALVVRHDGRAETVPLRAGSSGVHWVAFYADCTHEVKPLESGIRVALVYNLVRQGAPTRPVSGGAVAGRIASDLRAWGPDDPVKLAFVLEHRYSEAEIGWTKLKGADDGRAMVLRDAAAAAGVTAHLALLSVDVEWSAEELQHRSWGRGRSHYSYSGEVPDDLELYEEIRNDRVLQAFVDASDVPSDLAALPVMHSEVWPRGSLDDERPDEVTYHEATGNEGATLTQMYRRTVVVLWPSRSEDALIAQRGLGAVLRAAQGIDESDRLAGLVEALLHDLPHERASMVGELVDLLVSRELTSLAGRVLEHLRWLDRDLLGPLCRLLGAVSEPRAAVVTAAALARLRRRDPDFAMNLVQHATRGATDSRLWVPTLDRVAESVRDWTITDGRLAALVALAWHLDHPHLEGALFGLLEDETAFDHGVNAALELDTDGECPAPWREHIVEGLKARTKTAPVRPSDFRKRPIVICRCSDCKTVSGFLLDPESRTFTFAASQRRRRHVLSRMGHLVDVTTEEVRTGNPHKLVMTKTNRRYELARKRFDDHLDALAVLDSST